MKMRAGLIAAAAILAPALLAPSSGLALTKRTAQADTQGANGFYTATARCRDDERVISGGWDAAPDAFIATSRAKGTRRWQVSASDEATVLAYCSRGKGVIKRSETATTDGSNGDRVNVAASCEGNETVVAGGFSFLGEIESEEFSVYESRAAGGDSWRLKSFVRRDDGDELRAYAYCRRNVDIKTRSQNGDPIADDQIGDAVVACKSREQLFSGGYRTTPRSDWFNTTGPDLFYYASRKTGNGWRAEAVNNGAVNGRITTYAYCKA